MTCLYFILIVKDLSVFFLLNNALLYKLMINVGDMLSLMQLLTANIVYMLTIFPPPYLQHTQSSFKTTSIQEGTKRKPSPKTPRGQKQPVTYPIVSSR